METSTKILATLGAGALCLSACPGTFSGLSNDGKQGPAPRISQIFDNSYLYGKVLYLAVAKFSGEKGLTFLQPGPCTPIRRPGSYKLLSA